MNSWTILNLELRPHSPEILASNEDARAIALMIPAGESFDDHQVHESAWVTVIDGEVEITTSDGQSVIGSTGLVVAFAPNERHAVHARSDARLLLLLTPWPGVDHPGAMTLEQKANARHDAAASASTYIAGISCPPPGNVAPREEENAREFTQRRQPVFEVV